MTQSEEPGRDLAPAADPDGIPLADSGGLPIPDSEPPPEPEAPARSFIDDLRDLASDAQTLFEAEKAYQGARLSYGVSRGKGVAVSFALAGALAYFAVIALVVGLLLALTPLLTAWGALAVVTVTLLLGAYLFYRAAMKKLQRMRTFLGPAAASESAL